MLKDIIELLKKEPQDKIIKLGFEHPHSYRGDYHELSFEPKENAKVSDMLKLAEGAMGKTYEGYKGGDFTMNEYSDCYLAEHGETGPELSPLLLSYMLKDIVTLE